MSRPITGTGSEITLLTYLPDSLATDAEVIAIATAIDPELRGVGASLVEAVVMPRIDQQTEAVLDALAWSFRFNELQLWESGTLDGKRRMMVGIFETRKKSGTKYALSRMFEMIGVTIRVVEWFEEAAPPYTYRVIITITDTGVTLAQLLQVGELRLRFAPARCQMSELAVESDRLGPVLIYPVQEVGLHVEITHEP